MTERNRYAQIDWRDDGQPLSRAFDDIYFSTASGLEETRYVFLHQNELPRRWGQLNELNELDQSGRFTIGETGFGTGLNFLAAWQLWRNTAPQNAQLHFVSVEKYPLHRDDLQRALQLWPELRPLAEQLLAQYPTLLTRGLHRLQFDDGRVSLTLVIGEASDALQSLRLEQPARDCQVDAWFLDGFAPAKNPAMWSERLFENIAALSKPGATFATFTCAGIVKRELQAAGFALEKVPGFGHKREMLRGQLQQPAESHYTATPWHLPNSDSTVGAAHGRDQSQQLITNVAIIGAGIAGSTTARALAERGLQVQVFERGSHPGSGASGNDQGILYAKLSHKPGPNGDFNLHALQFALRYYRKNCPQAVHFSGLLQLAQDEQERLLQQQLANWLAGHRADELVRQVSAPEASEIAGLPIEYSGIYFPGAGWLEPRAVCGALLRHPNIQLHCETAVDALEPRHNGWQLHANDKPFTADAVVVCTANDITHFPQTNVLPLRPIRGQVSIASKNTVSRQLKVVVCGEGYLTPAVDGRHSFGATFKLKQTDTSVIAEEHRENLATLAQLLPKVAASFDENKLTGRAALRAASPDYLPMAGPVPRWDSIAQTYAQLAKNRKLLIPHTADYWPGLFVLGGLGSRGFTYAPLAAEMLAAWICNEVMPVNSELVKALHPARFAIRALGKNKKA